MEEPVIFYALLRDWHWSILAVIKETDQQISYYDRGNRVRRTTKPARFYRFDTEADALIAKSKMEALESQQDEEIKRLRERHSNELTCLAASFVQAVKP